MEKIRTSVYLPEDLKVELKMLCAKLKIPMSEFIEAAIREKIKRENKSNG